MALKLMDQVGFRTLKHRQFHIQYVLFVGLCRGAHDHSQVTHIQFTFCVMLYHRKIYNIMIILHYIINFTVLYKLCAEEVGCNTVLVSKVVARV